MIISRKRGYIFVHIPKTGGTSLALALEARAAADDILIGDTPKARRRKHRVRDVKTAGRLWKHSRLRDLPGLVSETEMRDLFVFTLVRNPWDRMVSYYHWLRVQTFDNPAVERARNLPFDTFVRQPETLASFRANPYGSHVRLPSGAEHCNAFLRLEHLAEDLAPVERHLGFSLGAVPRANASDRPTDYRSCYSSETRDLVGQACAEDIGRFDYVFDGDDRQAGHSAQLRNN